MAERRKTVAVLFGGRSVEHDVSILTGLQYLEALDQSRYRGLPVYIAPDGQWWTGEALRRRGFYPLSAANASELQPVTLPVGVPVGGPPHLLAPRSSLLGTKLDRIGIDIAVPALHGSHGEDGALAGMLTFAGIPYAGCRALGAAAAMDKHMTKQVLRGLDIPVLDHWLATRPGAGDFLTGETVRPALEAALGADPYPVIVKPRRLGSSIGVRIARDMDALLAALSAAFRLDDAALVEPLVPDLVEYNIAVMRRGGEIATSAVETPLKSADLLDFREKYLSGEDAGGPKLDAAPSEGMASLNREIAPDSLTPEEDGKLRRWAGAAFAALDLAGTPRIDFLCNRKTGEIWLNEVNPIPGSFAYFLWQAATPPLSFTDLASALVEEGLALSVTGPGETTAGAGGAEIFRRG